MATLDNEKVKAVLQRWLEDVQRNEEGHYNTAKSFRKNHRFVGYPLVILSAVVGSAAFFAIDNASNLYLKILALGTGTVTAILAAVQTFSRFSELADQHREAGAKFSNIRREIELVLEAMTAGLDEQRITGLRTEIDQATDASPEIPHRHWREMSSPRAAKKTVGSSTR